MALKSTARACLFAAAFAFVPTAASAGSPVVELFTSQGCSSCPPADALLGELAGDGSIIALSMPVDYWDYLGWKDSFGSPQHSARQKSYAHARGDRAVYTPQIVVNGRRHVVGSNRAAIVDALKADREKMIDVVMDVGETAIRVDLPEHGRTWRGKAVVWIAGFSEAEEVAIGRGENAGRQVVYHNVVRKMVRVGHWDGHAASIEIKRSAVFETAVDGCAVIVQEDRYGGTGPIIGAALMVE